MRHKQLIIVLIAGLVMALGVDRKSYGVDLFDSIAGQSLPYQANFLSMSIGSAGDAFAQQFNAPSAAVIDSLSMVVGISPAATGNIDIAIYTTNPADSSPGSQVGSKRTVDVSTFPSVSTVSGSLVITGSPMVFSGLNVNLASAAKYYVVLSNYTGSSSVFWGSWSMPSSTPSPGAGLETQAVISSSWTSFGSDNPFLMKVSTAAVPEPSTWALMTIAAGAVAGISYRRRKA